MTNNPTLVDLLLAEMMSMADAREAADDLWSEPWGDAQWAEAKVRLEEAFPLVRDSGDHDTAAHILYRISQCHAFLNDTLAERATMRELLRFEPQESVANFRFIAHYRIGCICHERGELREALSALKSAWELAQEFGNEDSQISTLENLLAVSRKLERWDVMAMAAESLAPLIYPQKNMRRHADVLCDLGCAYLRQEKWTEAEFAFTELWEAFNPDPFYYSAGDEFPDVLRAPDCGFLNEWNEADKKSFTRKRAGDRLSSHIPKVGDLTTAYQLSTYPEWRKTLRWIKSLGPEHSEWDKAAIAARITTRLLKSFLDADSLNDMLELMANQYLETGRLADAERTFREMLASASQLWLDDVATKAFDGLKRCGANVDEERQHYEHFVEVRQRACEANDLGTPFPVSFKGDRLYLGNLCRESWCCGPKPKLMEIEGWNLWQTEAQWTWAEQAWDHMFYAGLTDLSGNLGVTRHNVRVFALCHFYADWKRLMGKRVPRKLMPQLIEAFRIDDNAVEELAGELPESQRDLPAKQLLPKLVAHYQRELTPILTEGFGGPDALFVSLWRSMQPEGNGHRAHDEILRDMTTQQNAGYAWVRGGCPPTGLKWLQ